MTFENVTGIIGSILIIICSIGLIIASILFLKYWKPFINSLNRYTEQNNDSLGEEDEI